MVGQVEISSGTLEDLDLLADLWRQMVEHHRAVAGNVFPVRNADESWARKREEIGAGLAAGKALILLAKAEGVLRGFLLCELAPSGAIYDLGPRRGEVDSLVVADDARGCGVGTALLAACKAELVDRGITYWSIGVAEGNDAARRLYERLGFSPWVVDLAAPIT